MSVAFGLSIIASAFALSPLSTNLAGSLGRLNQRSLLPAIRARQNVIHECGLFQGRLGFDRAIMIVERDIELASNFDGIQQLRFDKGRISEVFGDVLATIRREFGHI